MIKKNEHYVSGISKQVLLDSAKLLKLHGLISYKKYIRIKDDLNNKLSFLIKKI